MRKAVHEVFTPKKEFNASMYVERPELERQLARSLKKNIHTFLFGESGNGKSWLFQRVLKQEEIPYIVANCGNASRQKSITSEIRSSIIDPGTATKKGYQETKQGELNLTFAKGGLSHEGQYDLEQTEPLLEAFQAFSARHKGKKIIVLDNLEAIFSSAELMHELADILMLLDDPRYGTHDINLLIVGVPNNILEYYSSIDNLDSIANRIQEIDRVGSLSPEQVREILIKGFKQLEVSITEPQLSMICKHTHRVTLGIAQRIHEYCEILSYQIEDNNWNFSENLLEKADEEWLKQGFRKSYTVIESHLNSKETSVARRNQVIYVIGKIRQHSFDSNRITKLIEDEFPETIPETNMGIGNILAELASGSQPLLRKINKTREYSVTDPRYIMCIRLMLIKESKSNRVSKKRFRV